MRQLGASMGKVLGYARVSTDAQDAASQKAVLQEHGAVVVFTETGNGSKLDGRDQPEAAIRLLERGDTLLAINPDRLARDTADLLTIGKRVIERGAGLKIVDPAITFDGTDSMAEGTVNLIGSGRDTAHEGRSHERLCPSGDAADLGPGLEGLGSGGSILAGREVIAAEVEQVVDLVVSGEEALSLAG